MEPGRRHAAERRRFGAFLRDRARQSTPLACFVLAGAYAGLALLNITASSDHSVLGHAPDLAAALLLVVVGVVVGRGWVPVVIVPWLVAALAVGLVDLLLVQSWVDPANLGIGYAILLMVIYAPFTFSFPASVAAAVPMIATYAIVAKRVFPAGARDQVVLAVTALLLGLILLGLRLRSLKYLLGTIDAAESTATHDEMTGLLNRRGLSQRAVDLEDLTAPGGGSLVAVFVDVDGLKAVNDAHGHQSGDQVVVAVARAIETAARTGDLIARFGGDEFVVLGPGSQVDPRAFATRISAALAYSAIPPTTWSGTVTIGVATARAGSGSWEDLIAAADADMYRRREEPSATD